MKVSLLGEAEINACIRGTFKITEMAVCSIADMFLALERIRKDSGMAKLREELCSRKNPMNQFFNDGRIMLLPLSGSALVDEAFLDPYCDKLEFDSSVFQDVPPEESVRKLNIKELNAWGWNI